MVGSTIYERVRDDILAHTLRPAQEIDEKMLCERYQVSRTPIREALIRLESDGLVDFKVNRGARVSALILSDFPRYLEALHLVKRAIARLASYRRHQVDIDRISSCLREFKSINCDKENSFESVSFKYVKEERELLLAISVASHNPYLIGQLKHLLTRGHRMLRMPYAYEAMEGRGVENYANEIKEIYGDVVGAIEEQDAARAELEINKLHQNLVLRLREYNEENQTKNINLENFLE